MAWSWGAPPAPPAREGVVVTYGVDEPGGRAGDRAEQRAGERANREDT